MVNHIKCQNFLAVDTESNSLFAYHEQVCLIQFSTPERDYLVDPLAIADLSPLGEIFASPKIEKIFHAAEYDIICLKRDFGFEFANLFDTMVAGRILGKGEIGLASMLENEFGVHLDKRYQRANWGRRPLDTGMREYAQFDTHFLIPLHNCIREELIHSERFELAEEDFNRLCNTSVPQPESDLMNCYKLVGKNDLTAQQMAVLYELYQYRERRAESANLPTFKVLSNLALVNIAHALPTTYQQLEEINGLSPKVTARHADGLLSAVQQGLGRPHLGRPNFPRRPDDEYLERMDTLRDWRKRKGIELGVPSDVILPRDVLYEIVGANPQNPDALKKTMQTVPWRYNQFGSEILSRLHSQEE
jgi:ribonuclease D